jgi:hypothetical protein
MKPAPTKPIIPEPMRIMALGSGVMTLAVDFLCRCHAIEHAFRMDTVHEADVFVP